MEDLNLDCSHTAGDFVIFCDGGYSQISIELSYNGSVTDLLITKYSALQLRDWLNEFLGESK